MKRSILLLALAAISVPALASAEAFVRVLSQEAPVHTGPAGSYREIRTVERGDIFKVVERGTRGYWFRVEFEDGTTGWLFGELIFPFEVVEDGDAGALTRAWRAVRRTVFGPSPVPRADVEISFSAGVLQNDGIFLIRPAVFIDSYFAVEGFVGLSPRQQDDVFLAGLGWTLRLLPGATIGPFVHAGIGAAHSTPKADNAVGKSATLMALSVGGGLETTLKKQITLRLDFRNWTLFDADKATNGQEISGGLAIFF